ncbi:MAG: ABC transporter permease [Armatimonadetes bacterium]|nr:ABC transporter permease [Armatimonadota bacterium]
MNFWHSLLVALDNLRVNKLRSFLTMLGIIIGVFSVILMIAIVEGARANVVKEFQRLGSSLIIIAFDPGRRGRGETPGVIEGLTTRDLEAIRTRCPLVANVSAEMGAGEQGFSRGGVEYRANINGVEPDYQRLRNVEVIKGRFINDEDMEGWKTVCVIGDKVKDKFFPGSDPIGQNISVLGLNLNVVGVLKKKGRSMGEDSDKVVLIPLSTLQKRLIGGNQIGVIFAQAVNPNESKEAMEQVWQLLMRLHDNRPDFMVDSQEQIMAAIGRVLNIFGVVMGSIGGLALLVGGIGIMNIMLVSVTERTREIGIRKAVGAKKRDILIQFLIESMTVSAVGGLIGIGMGAGVSRAVTAITKQVMPGGEGINTAIPLWAVVMGFTFSAAVGMFFGIYPAYRAARLDPIEALRHE